MMSLCFFALMLCIGLAAYYYHQIKQGDKNV